MRILVTGATGFVGRALCPALLSAGHQVIAAVRTADSRLPATIEQRAVGDIGPHTQWEGALAGCEAVVHLASHVHRPRERNSDLYFRVNAQGTRRLAQSAAACSVRRLVYVSTLKVHGEGGPEALTEESAFDPRDDYARSKRDGELALEQVAAGTRLETVILRPPIVYGPWVKANFLSLMRAIDRGLPVPASIRNKRSLLYAGNLADAIVRCLSDERASKMIFLLSDGEPISTAVLAERLAAAFGRRARLLTLPNRLITVAAALLGRKRDLERLAGSLYLADDRIRKVLDWRPPHSLQAGLEATAAWYRGEIS